MMAYHDMQQPFPFQNPQQAGWFNPQLAQNHGSYSGFGQGAYGQPLGQYGGQQFGQPNIGAWGSGAGWGGWGQHRQLSQNEVGDVVRQLVPLLPQLLAQAQPQAAFGHGFGVGGWGQAYGQRMLTQQDVNEVVRQILPILPQIVGALQGQGIQGPFQAAAIYGGLNSQYGTQNPFAQFANPYQQQPFGQLWQQHAQSAQSPWAQTQWPQTLQAFGPQAWGQQAWGQRNLTQQDVNEVARQLVAIIPQVINNLQAQGQQRMN
jgi:uncharacterized protein YidB (DUF937 family)